MNLLRTFILGAVALGGFAIATPAQARDHHYSGHRSYGHHYYHGSRFYSAPIVTYRSSYYGYDPYYQPYYNRSYPYYGYSYGPGVTFAFGGHRHSHYGHHHHHH